MNVYAQWPVGMVAACQWHWHWHCHLVQCMSYCAHFDAVLGGIFWTFDNYTERSASLVTCDASVRARIEVLCSK